MTEPVTTVTLTFNEAVRQQGTTVAVTAADGSSVSDGAARVVDATISQTVRALPAGPTRISWTTVSADGDPISGSFTFTVAGPPSPSPTTPAPTPATTTAPAPTSTQALPATSNTAGSGSTARWLWIGGAVVVITVLAGSILVRRRTRRASSP